MTRRAGAALAACATAALAALGSPAAASAHGLVGREDLPVPRWLFAWAAAVVLVVSFVGLAVLWPTPRLQGEPRERRLLALRGVPGWEVLGGALGVGLFVLTVYAGFAGSQEPTANWTPTFVYYAFWVGLAFGSFLAGDVFRWLNPWRAVARVVAWVAGRVAGPDGLPAPLPYPDRLGRWPAAAGILAFAWLELAATASTRTDPSTLALLALVYAAVQLVGMSVYGIEPWTDRADAFSVYFGLFARASPLRWVRGRLASRPVLTGAPGLVAAAGTPALLCVMIGSTSFDGFSLGPTWTNTAPHVQDAFVSLGLGPNAALEAANTVGLLGMVGLVGGLYALGVSGMRSVGRAQEAGALAARFAHTLIPIALAYVVAHYFSALVYQLQAMGYLVSDPLGDGSDLFGTGGATIDYGVMNANVIWYVQVGALILGHAGGLTLAHDRALATWTNARAATRSQYWMLAVMVAYTSLGLWLLSAGAS